jgi:hypothetical protein
MKKPVQVLFVRRDRDPIRKLEDRIAALDAMQRQLATKIGGGAHPKKRSAPLRESVKR